MFPLLVSWTINSTPRIPGRDLRGHLRAVIRRGVIDDEHPHIDAFLVIQHAGNGLLKEVTILVTRNNDAD